jgi:hypothetical protein
MHIASIKWTLQQCHDNTKVPPQVQDQRNWHFYLLLLKTLHRQKLRPLFRDLKVVPSAWLRVSTRLIICKCKCYVCWRRSVITHNQGPLFAAHRHLHWISLAIARVYFISAHSLLLGRINYTQFCALAVSAQPLTLIIIIASITSAIIIYTCARSQKWPRVE